MLSAMTGWTVLMEVMNTSVIVSYAKFLKIGQDWVVYLYIIILSTMLSYHNLTTTNIYNAFTTKISIIITGTMTPAPTTPMTCPHRHMVPCHSGGQCIYAWQVCDHNYTCWDRSDEIHCGKILNLWTHFIVFSMDKRCKKYIITFFDFDESMNYSRSPELVHRGIWATMEGDSASVSGCLFYTESLGHSYLPATPMW